jgi:hypothetical protein
MNKLYLIITICGCSLGMLIVAARFVGGQTHSSSWIKVLHLTDCELPCWIGIVPGETKVEEAETRLKLTYSEGYKFRQTLKGFEITGLDDVYLFDVEFTYWEGNLPNQRGFREIKLLLSERNGLSVTELISMLGSMPQRVEPSASTFSDNYLYLYYSRFYPIVVAIRETHCDIPSGSKIFANQPISEIHIFSKLPELPSHTLTWRGFNVCYR